MGEKKLAEAYILGIPFGLFGAHHFYLGNKRLGIFYACTLGVFTMGWIIDLFRMKYLVEDHNEHTEDKSLGTAYITALPPLGIFGAHHYYLDNVKLGLIYTFTFGIFGIGWIVDLFRMPKLVRKAGLDKKSIGTSYIMAMPPFGLFGAHHYYLGNYFLGIMYTCTLGIFTIGWITDLFRMKNLVKASNDPTSDYGTTKVTAYILCVSPLGLFGAHHFYLERYLNGGFYLATVGLFGFGWFFDMLRLPVLYERYADEDKHKYPDEAYLYWFPFGIFGLHHFYLERKKWGILYACTLGCLGIGWLIDGIRLPKLLKEFNKYVQDPDMNDFRICRPTCRCCSIYRCKRNCYSLFSCKCFENFSLSRSTSKNENETNGEVRTTPRDDFEVIKEMYPDENHEGYTEKSADTCQGEEQAFTVQESYDTYPTDHSSSEQLTAPAYDNGAYPGDPGYGEQYDAEGHTGNDEFSYPQSSNDENLDYNQEHYPENETYDENYANNDNYASEGSNNYQYGDNNYPNDEIRHHEDVDVTVQNEHDQYELQNRQNYQQSNGQQTDQYNNDVHM
ncbi:uncharacterized protein LOC132749907 isoform X2 [Ruditapes philippinarum]|uniref:uncharacterized protein LOC132749907 isoform X2 n=1 Tax=Ruditapes philippinarum TaxID=129788 RepID=UPI00295AF0CE|nr:uncharacterized protein LOC132749907 isoform X2 [Ruditapes philippinarum]